MGRHKVVLAVVSAFFVGFTISVAYMVTTGMFNPVHKLMAMNDSWATEEITAGEMVVTPETLVQKQSIYLCGDVETDVESDVKGLMGMSQMELQQVFDASDGWQVQFLSPKELVLARQVNELCPTHKSYRHLSIYQDHMAVFQGPLGIDKRLLEVVPGKEIKNLPPTLQLKLQQASTFYKQDEKTKAELQQELEFVSEKQLNAVLENLDELD
ncbi:hypothetical protein V6C27_11700 [Peptococcaceae bacterium 1198_IL3148]